MPCLWWPGGGACSVELVPVDGGPRSRWGSTGGLRWRPREWWITGGWVAGPAGWRGVGSHSSWWLREALVAVVVDPGPRHVAAFVAVVVWWWDLASGSRRPRWRWIPLRLRGRPPWRTGPSGPGPVPGPIKVCLPWSHGVVFSVLVPIGRSAWPWSHWKLVLVLQAVCLPSWSFHCRWWWWWLRIRSHRWSPRGPGPHCGEGGLSAPVPCGYLPGPIPSSAWGRWSFWSRSQDKVCRPWSLGYYQASGLWTHWRLKRFWGPMGIRSLRPGPIGGLFCPGPTGKALCPGPMGGPRLAP